MSAIGLIAAVLVTACVVPQVVAVLRSSEIGGVSVTGASFATISCGGWTLYAVRAGLVEVAWSSGIGAALWATIAVVVGVRDHRPPSLWTAVWAAAILGATATFGNDPLGMLLLGEAVTNTVPHGVRAMKSDGTGVSTVTFVMMGLGAAGWLVYGISRGDVPLAISSAVRSMVCATIVTLVRSNSSSGTSALAADASSSSVWRG